MEYQLQCNNCQLPFTGLWQSCRFCPRCYHVLKDRAVKREKVLADLNSANPSWRTLIPNTLKPLKFFDYKSKKAIIDATSAGVAIKIMIDMRSPDRLWKLYPGSSTGLKVDSLNRPINHWRLYRHPAIAYTEGNLNKCLANV